MTWRRTAPPRPSAALQWGHGSEAVDDRARREQCPSAWSSFNGAAARNPWMTTRIRPLWTPSVALQWGHGSEAVDDRAGTEERGRAAQLQWGHGSEAVDDLFSEREFPAGVFASMGPRLGSRG